MPNQLFKSPFQTDVIPDIWTLLLLESCLSLKISFLSLIEVQFLHFYRMDSLSTLSLNVFIVHLRS